MPKLLDPKVLSSVANSEDPFCALGSDLGPALWGRQAQWGLPPGTLGAARLH